MSARFALSCDDARVGDALREWLDAGALEPPAPVSLDVRVDDRIAPVQDSRSVFEQPGVQVRSGPPAGGVDIRWMVAPAAAAIADGEPAARVTLSHAAVEQLDLCTRSFFVTVLIFLLRRVGWHHVHAATAVDPTGRGWLFAGNARAGKSTTAAILASHGWGVGTDDIAFLGRDGERISVAAWRGPIGLRPESVALLERTGGIVQRGRGKTVYSVEELGGAWVRSVEPDIVAFLSVEGERTSVRAIGPGETLAELVRWSAWVVLEPDLAQGHLDLLAALGRQARSMRVRLGRDFLSGPGLLTALVG